MYMEHESKVNSRAYRVIRNQPENHKVYTLTLEPVDGEVQGMPGQFNMVNAFGIGQSALSISRVQDNQLWHTIANVGSVTNALSKVKPGSTILASGPFGTTWPIQKRHQGPVLIIAGGIGLAPIRPMIEMALKQKLDVTVLYGARSSQDIIFEQDLNKWSKAFSCYITVDKPQPNWLHHVGVVPTLIPRAIKDPAKTLVMMCGPQVMMRFSLYALLEQGIPKENIYLSMERNMQCGYGQCGHCQWGPYFICKDGPVMNFANIEPFFFKGEL
jgi:NAD(P)H-flavin reductase